ncbi:MAG TPA: phosphatase PAP2 family protein [Candidatus Sulfotelmatobacter sp.]|nr:phosphatase PAP2 family protein [Candidatus Sulfotelmatobacter sp.]
MPALRFLGIALVAAALYAWLGVTVSHAPPTGIDVVGAALSGEAVHVALVFTASCWFPVLIGFGVVGLVVAYFAPSWRERIFTSVLTTLVFWKVSDFLKDVFHRPRPPDWHLIHETSWSYSSGHAMFATIVYWLWAYFVWNSALPRAVRITVAPLLALWGCGVIWSRLALGAHYVTDLAGGVLLGIVALSLGAAARATLPVRR